LIYFDKFADTKRKISERARQKPFEKPCQSWGAVAACLSHHAAQPFALSL
jgi:hypothetical protein